MRQRWRLVGHCIDVLRAGSRGTTCCGSTITAAAAAAAAAAAVASGRQPAEARRHGAAVLDPSDLLVQSPPLMAHGMQDVMRYGLPSAENLKFRDGYVRLKARRHPAS